MPKKSAHKAKRESSSMNHGAQDHGHGKAASSAGASWKKTTGKGKAAGNNAKNGCFPKLLTLLLPFVAVGAYFLLRS